MKCRLLVSLSLFSSLFLYFFLFSILPLYLFCWWWFCYVLSFKHKYFFYSSLCSCRLFHGYINVGLLPTINWYAAHRNSENAIHSILTISDNIAIIIWSERTGVDMVRGEREKKNTKRMCERKEIRQQQIKKKWRKKLKRHQNDIDESESMQIFTELSHAIEGHF